MSDDGKVPLPNLEDRAAQPDMPIAPEPDGTTSRVRRDLNRYVEDGFEVAGDARGRAVGFRRNRHVRLHRAILQIRQRHFAVVAHSRFSSSPQLASAKLRRAVM